VNQHVTAPNEINAGGLEREALNIALDEFDSWTAVSLQGAPKLREDYVNTKCPTIEPFHNLNAVVAAAASHVCHYRSRAQPGFTGDIEQKGP
jgi:hypothetical protein